MQEEVSNKSKDNCDYIMQIVELSTICIYIFMTV